MIGTLTTRKANALLSKLGGPRAAASVRVLAVPFLLWGLGACTAEMSGSGALRECVSTTDCGGALVCISGLCAAPALGDAGMSGDEDAAGDAATGLPDVVSADAAADGALGDASPADGGVDMTAPDAGPIDAGPVDEAMLSPLTWLHPDISGWPITSGLRVRFTGTQVCLEYDKKDEWPVVSIFSGTDVVANAWVFARDGAGWYAGTFEWMRPGQVCKALSAVDGGHIKVAPFNEASGWQPSSGEEVYFMVSGLIRNPTYRNVSERTNIVRATWP